ncbi:hypothetical protein A0128_06010 [Leptospira tipperaryensis]|uniref:Uncharacterized protein n=1 Tax=Leptospira tipperaryensis TaxID=2564040 RepID=A0A1D7UV55_9LEPT|nr:hypothetical protein A0128_06010 [Leptospira tipperaryensis]
MRVGAITVDRRNSDEVEGAFVFLDIISAFWIEKVLPIVSARRSAEIGMDLCRSSYKRREETFCLQDYGFLI